MNRRCTAWWVALAVIATRVTTADAQVSTAPLAPQAPAPTPPAAPASQPAAALPELSLEFQAGFCTGWNSAGQVEAQRYGNWRALATLGQPAPDSPAGVAINSVQMYVLLQPLPPGSKISLQDGRTVTCPGEAPK